MKLTWKQIDPFLKNPDPKARVILIYGPDDGLMRERARLIGKKIVSDLNDPFNAVTLPNDLLNDDPARLQDEARAFSMMGGARLIRIENGGDKITAVIKNYLEDPSQDNLVLIEAGDLGARSSLRLLCEKVKNAAALPCYIEDERGVSQIIRQSLQENSLMIESDALSWLATNIAGDHGRVTSEIDKLITYTGIENKKISLKDAQACCGEAGAGSIETLIYALGSGQPLQAMVSYQQLTQEGVVAISILRSLQNHFKRLHYTHAIIQEGKNIDEAIDNLQPQIFFKYKPVFKSHVLKWNQKRINKVLERLNDIEAETKKTGTPVETLCSQLILGLSVQK